MDSTDGDEPERCDFCRLPCPEPTVVLDREDHTYEFCSESCRDAMQTSDRVFTEYHGHRRLEPGVSGLDAALPQGLPRNAFVLLGGQAGTRDVDVLVELAWRTLQRGEPAIVLTFQEPPTAIVERFLTMDWNVLPYLERKRLQILDCFTYRVDDRQRMLERMSDWNVHLRRTTEPAVQSVRDPSDVSEVQNKLDNLLDSAEMVDEGIVVVDSLTEFGALVQPVQAYDFVKDVRADVCKGRFVPIFAGATRSGTGEGFPHDLEYVADGIVDLALADDMVEDTLIKRVRIRKLGGVLVYPEWVAYEYTSTRGMVTFDPAAEIEKSEASEPDDAAAEDDASDSVDADDAESAGPNAPTDATPPAEFSTDLDEGSTASDDADPE